MTDISGWDATDAGNIAATPNGWAEGMPANGVNDVGRMMMGAVKRWRDHTSWLLASGGTGNAQTLTYDVAPTAYVAGDQYTFSPTLVNTGATTLNVNGLGALPVLTADGQALTGRELQPSTPVTVYHNGAGSFQIAGQLRQTIAATGYLKHPGGLLDQWGNATISAATSVAVVFPVAYSAVYGVQVTLAPGAGPTLSYGVGSVTGAGFTIFVSASATVLAYWRAHGI